MPDRQTIYWDSNVFLSLLNGPPARIKVITNCLDEFNENGCFIITSTESIVEVAHALDEKLNGRLDPRIEERIDAMWENPSIKMIDNGQHISSLARKLIRDAIPNRWSLTPKDAIHLASAYWYNKHVNAVHEFHTYDTKLPKFAPMIGIQVCEPYVQQMRF